MPHLCGIEKAHRRRRVVERSQKIGFDVIDLCCGCPQAVQNIGNVHLAQLAKPLLDDLDGDLVFSQTDSIGGAALHFSDQLHQRVHVFACILRTERVILDLLFDALFQAPSLNPSISRRFRRGDRWIRITKLRIIIINITWVGKSDFLKSRFPTS